MKRVFDFIKKWWKFIVFGLSAIGAVVLVTKARAVLRKTVMLERSFQTVPGDPNSIAIKDGKKMVVVKLPLGVTSDKVAAAGISEEGEWAVNVKKKPNINRSVDVPDDFDDTDLSI